jgi:hypothetical protein
MVEVEAQLRTPRRWIENDAEWFEQRMVNCDCCGRLIAKHFLMAEIDGREQTFCGDACADLFASYVLPVRGRDYRPPADAGALYEARIVK